MSRRSIVLAVAALAVVVIAVVVFLVRAPHPPDATTDATTAASPAASPAVPSVPVVGVTSGTFTERVSVQGRVGAPAGSEAKLAFAVPGVIAAIDVHVGDRVAAGAALAELDGGALALDVAQARDDARAAAAQYGGGSVAAHARAGAQARLAAARAHLTSQLQAKIDVDTRTLERQQALYAGGVAAAKDVDAARQQLALDRADAVQARADVAQAESDLRAAQSQGPVAQAQLAASQAKLAGAQRSLANAVLHAPAGGVVTAIFKHVGESADPSAPVLAIGPPSSDTLTLTATGDDARRIAPGDAVTTVVAARSARGSGVVRSVLPAVDPATQTATIVVDGVPPGAVPGDAVEASIAVGTRRGLVIPTASIVDDPQTGKSIVFVRTRTGFVAREITIAAGDDQRSLVAGGLRPGERIAGEGTYDLLAPSGGGG